MKDKSLEHAFSNVLASLHPRVAFWYDTLPGALSCLQGSREVVLHLIYSKKSILFL